jgi:hypothetical protein
LPPAQITNPKKRSFGDPSFIWLVAILLSILHGVLALTAAMEKSPTFDEPTHLTAGYSYWLKNDFRLDPENGNLPARWAALPLLLSRPIFPPTSSTHWKEGNVGRASHEFLYEIRNDPEHVLLQSRAMMAACSAGLCLLIFSARKSSSA